MKRTALEHALCIPNFNVFPMVIWAAFRMGQCRVNDHPYHAPQFIKRFESKHEALTLRGFIT